MKVPLNKNLLEYGDGVEVEPYLYLFTVFLGLLSVIAEFETDLRAERQAEGIKSALARGVKFGAKRKMTEEQVVEAMELQKKGEMTNQQIADMFEVGRSTLLRYVGEGKRSYRNFIKY